MKNSVARQYLSAGKKLMTLIKGGEKEGAPTRGCLKFTSAGFKQSDKTLLGHSGPLGWILGPGDFVIDVDPRNGGDESFSKLLGDFPELGELEGQDANGLCYTKPSILLPTVMTPRGGFHIYMKLPEKYHGRKFRKYLKKDYPGIDFLTKGSYCIICGSEKKAGKYVWADEDFGEFGQREVPQSIIKLTLSGAKSKDGSDDGSGSDNDLDDLEGLVGNAASAHWTEEAVLEMLSKLDHNMLNDDWARVGMALKDWDPTRGLELWEEWSRGGDTYKEGETEKRWRSLDNGDGVTMGTLSYMVKDADYDEVAMKVSVLVTRIEKASEKVLEFEIFPDIKKMGSGLGRLNKEKLVKAIQDRYKDVSGVRMSVSGIRQSISGYSGDEAVSGHFIEDGGDGPEWCKDWIYANSHQGFVDLRTLEVHKAESFNIENGIFIPENEMGSKSSASKYVADKGFVDKVDRICYLPTREERICTINGAKVLNSFNPRTVPVAATEFTEQGAEAVRLVERHIEIMCGSKENAQVLTQWFAHQVQFPGRQILWAPVIQSIPGLGKTFFAELLRTCLGDCNVGTVSPSQITSDFNGWATGVCVNSLEEFRVKGQNRYEAVNALKPLITDRMIQINEKGVKPYTTQNTTNYIACTNDKDSIPMDINDRRWWIIFVAIASLKEFSEIVGEDSRTYFPRLFAVLRDHGGEIRKWFLEYKITPEFMATKQAPMTDDKLSMIAAEEASFEGLSEVRELIKEGHEYYNEEWVSSSDLFDQLPFKYPEVEVTNRSKNAILKKLGYMPLPIPMKIGKKTRRIWSKKNMTNDEIRLKLSKKVTGDGCL